MRVLVATLFAALSIVSYSGLDLATSRSELKIVVVQPNETEAQAFVPFWKKKGKKKVKASNRLKKNNRRMGKNFKRKNDDTLRR